MRRVLLTTAIGLATPFALAQTFTFTSPRGATPGQSLELRVYGSGLSDLVGVIAFSEGLEFGEPKSERDDRATVPLQVREDCRLGRHLIALRTKRGITRVKSFHIGPLPSVVEERDAHSRAETAQVIPLDVTVDGRVLGEDPDWYAFDVAAGARVRLEVEGVRLGDYDWDPVLDVVGPDGVLLVHADDSALGGLDPVTAIDCITAGTYRVAIRDVGFRGSSRCAYRLHVGTFPRPLAAVPASAAPGVTCDVTLLGDGEPVTVPWTAPSAPGECDWFPVIDGRTPPTALRMLVDARPSFVEGALPDVAPDGDCAFHGVIGAPGEADGFPFRLTKGARIEVRVLAQGMRSPLDPVLVVRDSEGTERGSNDDGDGLDARLRFTAQSDGEITLCVRDQLGRGGADFAYRLEVGGAPSNPRTNESIPGRRPEDLGIAVPAGGRAATLLAMTDLDLRQSVHIGLADLPAGVGVVPVRTLEGLATIPMLVEAAADAPLGATLARPCATADADGTERAISHRHAFPLLRVRNDLPVVAAEVEALPIVVTDPCPFAIDVDPPTVPLVRSGSGSLTVHLTRAEGFKGTVTVARLWAPPGMSIATVTMRGDTAETAVAIGARSNAMLGRFPLVLVASASDGGVTRTVATRMFELEVQEPWLNATLSRARVEQGGQSVMRIEIEPRRELVGELIASLGRVPSGVAVEFPPIPLGGGAFDVVLKAEQSAPPGRHRYVYLRVVVKTPDGEITHSFGGGEIRVDVPLEPKGSEPGGGTR